MTVRLARFLNDRRGAVAPMAAIVMVGLVGLAGMVTDVGAWYVRRDALQAAADAAAMAAAGQADPAVRAQAMMTANGFQASDLVTVETGYYCADASLAPADRFSAGACATGAVTPSSPNAARVTATATAPMLFSALLNGGSRTLRVRSAAARIDEAGIAAGSGVAAIDPVIANAVLQSYLGGSGLSLTLVQYQALAAADVGAAEFLDALALRVGSPAATYGELVQSSVKLNDVLQTAADVASAHGAAVAAGALAQVKAKVTGDPSITLSKLFGLGVWSKTPLNGSAAQGALKAGLDLHQLTAFALQLAGGSHTVAVPTATLGLPGVAGFSLEASAIEPPQGSYFAFGPTGISVHTAQVRAKLSLSILGITGGPLPLYLESGQGDATLDAISCGADPVTDAQVRIRARSGVAALYLGAVPDSVMTNFTRTAALSDVTPSPLLTLDLPWPLPDTLIAARSQVTLGSGSWKTLTFVQPGQSGGDGIIGAPLSGSGAYSEAGSARTVSAGMGSALFSDLLTNISLSASVGGLTVAVPGGTLGILNPILSPVLSALDPVVDQLLAANGIGLGYLDVSATGVRCGVAATIA